MSSRLRRLGVSIWQARYLYLLLIPGVVYFAVFHYAPMSGLVLAFKKYNAKLGIWGSSWVGMANFQRIFTTPAAVTAIRNTLEINFSRLLFQFPVPILLALLINEVRNRAFKKVAQTVSYMPYFISTVVVCSMITLFTSEKAFIAQIMGWFGEPPRSS